MEKKLAGLLLIILALSLELNRNTVLRVSTQAEDFASRLEGYLENALPDDLLAEECEYVVPEGFNLTLAERLWRDFSFHVSAGYTTQELRREVEKLYGNSSLINATLSNGETVALNISSISVERSLEDGSVSIRIPVASKSNLSYVQYNFTKAGGFYEAWNKTLVRLYRVWRREQGWYTYTMRFLETNRSVRIVSRIWGKESATAFTGVERVEWAPETGEIPVVSHVFMGGSIMVAVPGHYEDVRIIVPEQKRSFKVLFPAYDPLIQFGWIVATSISSTSLSVGEALEVSYLAEYWSLFGEEPEPLNATLTLSAPEAFEPLNSLEHRLNSTHYSGVFRLRAVKPGTYELTLTLTGNASFSGMPGKEVAYEVQVVSPPVPSLSVTILGVNTSVLKHAGLTLRLSNNGGGTARNIRIEITGTDIVDTGVSAIQGVSRDMGSIGAGETRVVEFMLRLLRSSVRITVKTTYFDEEGNPYTVKAYTTIYHQNFWVPEHFEEYTVVVPEHEETLRVFVPGYEVATHIRLYALWDPYIIGAALPYMRSGWVYEADRPVWGVGVPTHTPSLGLDSMPIPGVGVELPFEAGEEALTGAGVKIMVTSIEPHYEYLGVLKEDEALRLVNEDRGSLRSGNVSLDFRVEPLKPYWVEGKHVVLNATQLALYRFKMEELKKTNPDIDYDYKETVADVRTVIGKAKPGYITLTYHPLRVVGEGPLKTVRVRNFAGIEFNYKLGFETSILTVFGKTSPEKWWKNLYVKEKEDSVLLSSLLDTSRREVKVNLTYNGKLVANTCFILEPEPSPFWIGFWEGIKEKALGIVLTTAILIVLAIPTGGGTLLAEAKTFLASTLIPQMMAASAAVNLIEIVEAYWAYDRLGKVAEALDGFSQKASNNGYWNTSSFFRSLGDRIKEGRNLIVENTALDLLADLTVMDLFLVFGSGNATEYEKGRAWGRVVGTALSFLVYAYTYYRFFTDGPKLLSWQGKIKSFLRGVYNWVTPPLWDFGVALGSFAADKVAASLYLSEQNKRFKEYLNLIREDEASLSRVVEFTDGYLENALDVSERLGLSEKAFLSLLWAYGNTAKALGEEDWNRFLREIQDIGGESRRFADEFLRWLYNAEGEGLKNAVLEIAPKLTDLSAGELESMGRALAKVGESFENGFKLFNSYFEIAKHYDSKVVETVKEVFLRYVSEEGDLALKAWSSAVENGRIAAKCSGKGSHPKVPEDLARAYGFKDKEPFTVVVRRGGDEYWVAGWFRESTTRVSSHEGMFENLGLGAEGKEYVELIPRRVDGASIFPTLGEGKERIEYHLSQKWDSVDGALIQQKGGEGAYLTSRRKIGYLDEHGVFYNEPGETHYYVREVKLGGKLEFDVDEVSTKGYMPVYEVKLRKIGYVELGEALQPLLKKGWVTYDADTGRVRLAGFQEFNAEDFEYEGKIAADAKHHGGAQAVFVLNPGDRNERALSIRVVADPVTGALRSRLDFSYSVKQGDWLEVTELEKGLDKDGGAILRIKHEFRITAEETVYCNTYMEWKPELQRFKDARILTETSFLEEGVEQWLKLPLLVEYIEGNEMVLKISDDLIKEYKGLFLEVTSSYDEHAKGVLSCEILNKLLDYNEVKKVLGLPEGTRLVDKSGGNKGEYYFDVFTKKSENELTFIAEVKSTFTGKEFESMFKDARDSLSDRVSIVGSKLKLPELGHLVAMSFKPYGVILIKWRIENINELIRR